MFLRSVDASDRVKDANLLFELLDEVVMEVGVENVVQVITDNASNYVLAGKMLEEKHKTIFWTTCVAHCIDLMLEDIGKQEWIKNTIEHAKSITKYIYNHSWVLSLMRKNTEKRELLRPAITRFATHFLTLQSIASQSSNLQNMFASDEWNESQWACRPDGKDTKKKVNDPKFWKKAAEIVKIAEPLLPPYTHLWETWKKSSIHSVCPWGQVRVKVLSPNPQLLRLGQLLAKPRGVVPNKNTKAFKLSTKK
jgi:hypothetical protein